MIFFKHKTQNIIVISNLKVMSSSLKNSPNLIQIGYKKFLRFRFHSKCYILTRNPYNRLFSFYNNKFIQRPGQGYPKVFLSYLNNISKNKESIKSIHKKLLRISFDEMINFLPEVYWDDAHLHPQYITKINFKILKIPFKFIAFRAKQIKMENESDLIYFAEQIGLDVTKQCNSTEKISMPKINQTSINIINTIYAKDFNYLGYEKKFSPSDFSHLN